MHFILGLAVLAVPEVDGLAELDAALRGRDRVDPVRLAIVTGPAWLGVCRDDAHRIREAAADTLVRAGRPAVPVFVAALREDAARRTALAALTRLGPHAEDAVPALVKFLGERDDELVDAAVGALVAIGPGAVPGLVVALSHPDSAVALDACRVLGEMGPHGRMALPALRRVGRDPSQPRPLRTLAEDAIGSIERAVQAQRAALLIVGAAGPLHVVPLVPTARAAPDNPTPGPRRGFGRGARQAKWVAVTLLLLKLFVLIGSGAIAGYLGLRKRRTELQAAATDPMAARLAGLADADAAVRSRAARELAEAGPTALPRLLPALLNPAERVRESAGEVIRLMGAAAVPELGTILIGPDKKQRDAAAVALVLLGSSSLPVLEAALDAPRPAARAHACQVLARLGEPARRMLPALREATADPDPEVRHYAAEAVWSLDPNPR